MNRREESGGLRGKFALEAVIQAAMPSRLFVSKSRLHP